MIGKSMIKSSESLGGITAQKYTNEKLGGSGRNFFSEVEDYWYLDQSSSDTRGLENNGNMKP